MMRGFALVLLVAAAVSGCRAQPRLVSETSCHVALDYMKDFKARAGRPIGIWPWISAGSLEEADAFLAERPEIANSEDAMLLRATAATEGTRLGDHCPEIGAWLKTVGAVDDEAEVKRLIFRQTWSIALLSISVPVVSRSGDSVSFFVEESWGPSDDCGPIQVIYRRGTDGQWRKAELR